MPVSTLEAPAQLPLLFGWDETSGVIAVEIVGNEAVLQIRDPESGLRTTEHRPFRPWILVGEGVDPAHLPVDWCPPLKTARWNRLEGSGLVWLVEFPNWSAFLDARSQLRNEGYPHHAYAHPVKQFL